MATVCRNRFSGHNPWHFYLAAPPLAAMMVIYYVTTAFPASVASAAASAAAASFVATVGGAGGVSAGARRRAALSPEDEARLAHARVRAQQLARLGVVGARRRGRDAQAEAAQRRAGGRRSSRREYDRLLRTARRDASRAGDDWCRGLSDGLHGDALSHPPHRAYFRCSGYSLAGIYFCPGTSRFDEEKGRCEEGRGKLDAAAAGEERAAVASGDGSDGSTSGTTTDTSALSPSPWADEQAGAELNALLAFKAAVINFQSALRSWVVPRHAANSSLSPAAFFCRWRFNLTIRNDPSYQGIAGLVGAFPTQLSACSSLRKLELSFHRMVGGIPDGVSQLKALEELNLKGNLITGTLPTALFSLSNLKSLTLSTNAISGPIPPQISLLSKTLMDLDLRENHLSGSLPEEIGQLKNLGMKPAFAGLSLQGNNFSGSLPASISNLQSLQNLDLSHNQFSGSLPQGGAFLSALTHLATLQITSNQFSGSLPLSFACTTSILTISLGSNQFWGTLPASLDNCAMMLLLLDVSSNNLTGPLPPTFWKSLSQAYMPLSLMLQNNSFSGSLSPAFAEIATLVQLDATAPEALATCRNIIYYDASNNQLSGTAADVVDRLAKAVPLVSVRLGGNRIQGEIPENIFLLSFSRELNLSGNVLTGSIPSTVALLNRLQVFDVSGNGLSSSLPSSLGSLSYLSLLDVSRNGLSGPIPPELAPPFLPFLTLLNVSHNAFSGAIPFGFSNTNTTATALDFSYNNLSGPIYPGNLSLLPASAFAANPGLCGGAGYPDCPAPPGQALSTGAVVGIVVACVAALALAVGGVWYALFYQRSTGLEGGTMLVFERLDFKLNIRSILDATDTFNEKFLLGRGGFGSVYKATLADGREVAIKQLASGSSQGQREFEAEMHTLGAVRHRNLVVLVAAYLSRPPSQERLLIYDFLPGGSLDDILGRDMPKGSPMRRWERGRLSFKSDVFAFGVVALQVLTGKLLSDKVLSETVISRWVSTNPLEEIVDRRIENWEKYTDEMEAVVMLGLMCTARLPADRPSMIEALEALEGLSTFALSMRKGESGRGESGRGESGRGESVMGESGRGGSVRGEILEVRGCEKGSEGAEGHEEVSSVGRETGSGRRQEEKQEEREEVKLEVSQEERKQEEQELRKEEKQEESKEEIQDEKQEETQEERGGTRRETGRATG
ncbi:unnamed protein product [Closterium sp. Naga37s-1]|nr:unnamed protein product [Closterium sp. Naga37s-1]